MLKEQSPNKAGLPFRRARHCPCIAIGESNALPGDGHRKSKTVPSEGDWKALGEAKKTGARPSEGHRNSPRRARTRALGARTALRPWTHRRPLVHLHHRLKSIELALPPTALSRSPPPRRFNELKPGQLGGGSVFQSELNWVATRFLPEMHWELPQSTCSCRLPQLCGLGLTPRRLRASAHCFIPDVVDHPVLEPLCSPRASPTPPKTPTEWPRSLSQ